MTAPTLNGNYITCWLNCEQAQAGSGARQAGTRSSVNPRQQSGYAHKLGAAWRLLFQSQIAPLARAQRAFPLRSLVVPPGPAGTRWSRNKSSSPSTKSKAPSEHRDHCSLGRLSSTLYMAIPSGAIIRPATWKERGDRRAVSVLPDVIFWIEAKEALSAPRRGHSD
jgi:hypothetical protein